VNSDALTRVDDASKQDCSSWQVVVDMDKTNPNTKIAKDQKGRMQEMVK
jgi:hypothetical protein